MRKGAALIVVAAFLWPTLSSWAAQAPAILKTLQSFTGTNGLSLGGFPEAKLTLGTDGQFYGTTIFGGTSNLGTVFRVRTNGALVTLCRFDKKGYHPQAGVCEAVDGTYYGTTSDGGIEDAGTIFRVTPGGVLTQLASLSWTNGAWANGLIQGKDGNFYGTAYSGGTNGYGQYGTIFKLSTAGKISVLYHFGHLLDTNGTALDGANPQAGLVEGRDGLFYGTTFSGGTNGGFGTVFRITTNGIFNSLASFNCDDGASPMSGLVQGADGNLYGTASAGGLDGNGTPYAGNGTLFKVTTTGQLSILHYFAGYPDDGAQPNFVGLAAGTDGFFYGTTYEGGTNGSGTIFRSDPEGRLSIIYAFSRPNRVNGGNGDGAQPLAGVTQGKDGNFYGVTSQGGAKGYGTIFCLSSPTFTRPQIQRITRTNATTTLTWIPLPSRRYQPQYKAMLAQGGWSNLGIFTSTNNALATVTDSKAAVASRVYRLVLLP